jgi:hypothetical protein
MTKIVETDVDRALKAKHRALWASGNYPAVAAELIPALGPELGAGENAELSPTPILITEQEVVFSTSAAVSLPRTKTIRRLNDATGVVAATLRQMFLASTARPRPARRHYPPRPAISSTPSWHAKCTDYECPHSSLLICVPRAYRDRPT